MTDKDICKAINEKSIITFLYGEKLRVVEPHAYGIHKTTNNEVLRGFQIGGDSESKTPGKLPGWRLFIVSKIKVLKISKRKFMKERDGYNQEDKGMSKIFCKI